MHVALITGSRTYKKRRTVWQEIYKRRNKLKLVIHGGAKGADLLGDECAKLLGIQTVCLEALWEFHHKAAGPIRNSYMLTVLKALHKADHKVIVLAFHPDLKKSKGTADMVKRAKKEKFKVKVFK